MLPTIIGHANVSLTLIGVKLHTKIIKSLKRPCKNLAKARKGQVKNDHYNSCLVLIFFLIGNTSNSKQIIKKARKI